MYEETIAHRPVARHTMTPDDAARAAAQLRPAWSDHCLTETVVEPGEAAAVRFAVDMDGVEAYQWADEVDGALVLTGRPAVSITPRAGDMSAMALDAAASIGDTLLRLTQYVALCNDVATEVGHLRMSDLVRIARRKETTPALLLIENGRRGVEVEE